MNDLKRYYIIQEETQTGPMRFEELMRVNYSNRITQIWTDGFTDWVSVTTPQEAMSRFGDGIFASAGAASPPSPTFSSTLGSSPLLSIQSDPILAMGYEYAHPMLRACVAIFNFTLCSFIAIKLIPNWSTLGAQLIAIALAGIFFLALSATLGHAIFQLKVVDATTGEDIKDAGKGALRELIKIFMSWLLIPIIWCIFDPRKQNVYDKVMKTVVVKKNKKIL